MIKLAISGCQGRMGQRITHLALQDEEFTIFRLLEDKNCPNLTEKVHDISVHTEGSAIKGADVLIEFTTPDATISHLNVCLQYGVKMVIGTTGLTVDQIQQIKKAAETLPIVFASNMSVGVNILFGLTRETARKTGEDYTIKISETHHIHKKDKPSGTAKTIAEIAERASGTKVSDIQAIREGEVIGDHQIIFESSVDTITLSHHAKTRDIFVKGSLVAAKFLASQKKGLFNMEDILTQKLH